MAAIEPTQVIETETLAQVRRVSGRVMNMLDSDPVWMGPTGKIAIFAAVQRNVASMVKAGVTSEKGLFEAALAQVLMSHPKPPHPPRKLHGSV